MADAGGSMGPVGQSSVFCTHSPKQGFWGDRKDLGPPVFKLFPESAPEKPAERGKVFPFSIQWFQSSHWRSNAHVNILKTFSVFTHNARIPACKILKIAQSKVLSWKTDSNKADMTVYVQAMTAFLLVKSFSTRWLPCWIPSWSHLCL